MRKLHTASSPAPRSHRLTPLARAAAAAVLLAAPLWLQAQTLPNVLPNVLPTGLQIVQGQASVATLGAQMTIRNSPNAILNWQSFNIGAGNKVAFEQASAASKVLNRVTGNDPSAIFGSLISNGQVWLLNPSGVLFGPNARVDVAGLVTSTLRLNDNDFLAGRYRFSAVDGDSAGIRNEGALTSSFGGQIVLLGSKVENAGSVEAPGGQVALAAARSVELVDTGLPNLTVKVEVPAGEVLNLGRLAAAGGTIDVYGGIVNQQGLVQADTLGADAQGRIVLKAADTLMLGEQSRTQAVGSADGATGGQIDLLGAQVGVPGRAEVDVSGAAGGGAIRLGGGLQGQDSSVPNARAVYFGPEATLKADASGDAGPGGRIVLWSDEATRAYGTLSARGGRLAGDGGFVETSGGWLDARPAAVDLAAPGGRAGTWLLDPFNITINNAGPNSNISGGPSFSSSGDSAVLSTATIAAALNAGTSVTVATGSGATAQSGDILVDAATLNLTPTAPVSFTLQAGRDIVVRNSAITSTGQPLSLDLQAAGSGIGAVEVFGSSITTAGGNITLGGSISQQLPRPGGGFTADIHKPAVAYTVLTGNPSITSSGGNEAVTVRDSVLNLGSGTFKATGFGTLDNRDAVVIGSAGGTTQINAGRIELVGYTSVPAPVQFDVGVFVGGNGTDLAATQAFSIEGGGREGIEISDGARLTLNAAPASGASLSMIGFTSDDAAVALLSDNFDLGTAGRGTRITVNNATVSILGVADNGAGLVMLNYSLAPGPLLDLANATGVTMVAQQTSTSPIEPAMLLSDVELVLAKGATSTLQANGLVSLTAVSVTGENATLSMSGSGFSINSSTLAASAGTLALDFATTGTKPTGVLLENTIVTTGGGDVRFGASQIVSSSLLGSTAVLAPWVETTADNTNYSGASIPAALWLIDSTIDAGAGRVHGGGAARTAATNAAGVTLEGSIISAREISLAGRSEGESAINVSGGSHTATQVFSLDALGATNGFYGMFVGNGATLRLSDPTAATGSGMSLQAVHVGNGPALGLEGGNVGSALETTVSVDGGSLLLSGTVAGGSAGVQLLGSSAAPGGLLINALGATSVSINATNQSSAGAALLMSYMNLLGPQNSASSPLNITASGGRLTGTPSSVLTTVTLSSGGPVNFLADGLLVTGSRLGSDTRLALQTNTGTGARAAAPIAINNSTLEVSGAGAELRIEGSAGDAVRGELTYNAGQGVTITDSTLQATGNGAHVALNGRGSDAGGTGVTVVRSTLSGENIAITGRGLVDGDGVWMQDSTNTTLTTITATNLAIGGQGADTATTQTHVGVLLGNATVVNFSGRGVATVSGDTVQLGSPTGAQPLVVGGDAASFAVSTTGSQRVVNSTLDFSAGSGTDLTLQADSDASLAGRARVQGSTLRTGGGNLTVSGVGVYSIDPQGGALPFNQAVAEGAFGVMLAGVNTIEAGTGTVTMTGRSASDGRPDVPTAGGSVGLGLTSGTTAISAGSVVLGGHGGDKGAGVDVGVAFPGSVLNLQATSISVTGQGVGIDPNTLLPYAGVNVGTGSSWNAGGTLSVNGVSGGVALTGVNVNAGDLGLNSGGALTLVGSSLAAAATLTATASGAPINGSLLSIDTSTLTAGAALSLDATASAPGVALQLLTGVNITGGSVTLAGTASGAASNAPGIRASASTGAITATAGPLSLTGRNPALDTEGILLEGGWALSAPSVINVTSDGTTLLRALSTFSPTFSAAQSVNLTLNSPFGITLGDAASALDAGTLATAVAGLAPTATLVLTVPDASGLSVAAPFSLPARLQVRAEQINFTATGSLTSTAPGDAILLTGVGSNTVARFDNLAGPGALSAANGRWVVQLTDPANAILGGLGGDFTAYNLATTPWATDASGNLITPAAGNAIGFAVAPAAVSGTVLGGLLTKVYDASTGVTLDPLGWTITGLVAGDTLALSGANAATLADKNVGTGKAVTLNPASVFTVTDASGKPVFGYDAPVFTATVTPATLTVAGAAAASKVYDGNTSATLGAGSITPLGGDAVTLGAATGSFADKNVGSAKPVTLSALSLTGADAGNYTLVQPTGLVADITPLALAVTGLAANGKVYDATTAATLGGTAAIAAIAGDSVLLAGSAAASFADKNVGTAKPVAVSGYSLSGADAGNYTLAQPTGLTADITVLPLALTGLSATAKVYDATTVAPLAGTASIAPLAGDTVTLAGAAAGSFGDKNVGTNKLVGLSGLTLAGADAGNYLLAPPVGMNASITPAPLALAGVSAANKVYDATTAATATAGLTGVVAGDTVSVGLAASFADANVGTGKTVGYSATPAGADAANYTLAVASGSTTANITPATLTYVATPLSAQSGSLPLLTGSVTGFVGGETLAAATTGTLAWTTPATGSSPAGSYAIAGSGLAALNYQFVQAPGNATALTLSVAASIDPVTAANSIALSLGLQSVQVALAMSSPTEGRVLDVTPAFALGADGREGEGLSFRPMNFSLMTRDEVQSLLAARASYKKKVFATSLSRLEQDPALADVRPCKTEAELAEGNCLITEALKQQIQEIAARAVVTPRKPDRRKIKQAVLPNIERKLALLIGINKYSDKRVPELEGSLRDTRAIRTLLEGRLGYETTVVEDASREAMIRAFNKLALDADANDSVVIYYAGHGDVVPVKGEDVGYWIPSDANADNPATWLSNADIARLVGAVGARQLMLISDSCFSGTLAGNEKVTVSQTTDAADLLKRKAAVVMSSGGNEPVADEGREGHSFFAWHFMRAIEGLDNWQVGGGVFERVRAAVVKDFPQTPHYGASRTAGHQGNTDYLFERREFEPKAP